MHVYLIEEALETLRRGEQPQIRSIEAELWPVPLAKVRDFGLQEKWINELGNILFYILLLNSQNKKIKGDIF